MSVGIYIDPPSASLLEDRFLAESTGRFHSSLARCLAFVKDTFEAQGVPVHTADRLPPPTDAADTFLYVSVGHLDRYPRLASRKDVILSAFMVTESPVVEPRIYRGLARAGRHFKRIYSCVDPDELTPLVGAGVECLPLRWPIDFRGVDLPLWSNVDRGFLVMVNMNKLPGGPGPELFTERMRAVEFFSRTAEIDLYGVGWNQASARMGQTWMPRLLQRAHTALRDVVDRIHPDPLLVAARHIYRGELETKWEVLAQYHFALCFENTATKGWLTEKLFECLRAGTIPIYGSSPESVR